MYQKINKKVVWSDTIYVFFFISEVILCYGVRGDTCSSLKTMT